MNAYELTLRKEVMLEKAAGILGELFRFQQSTSDTGTSRAAQILFDLVGDAKNGILLANDAAALDAIEGKFDLSKRFVSELEKSAFAGEAHA